MNLSIPILTTTIGTRFFGLSFLVPPQNVHYGSNTVVNKQWRLDNENNND
ncbi:MAG: hypothetical protein K0S80_1460 [Neobacillus sp.]|nr:hypothetical protein [Neobacillus sp.]